MNPSKFIMPCEVLSNVGNLWIISPAFWSNTPFKRFFRIQGLSLLKYAYFRWLAAFFSVKGQTSPLIYVVESFRPAIASEYHLAPANRAYKRFSFQTVIDSVLSGRIRQIKPDLKQVHPQHFFDTHRRTSSFSLGIIRFNDARLCIPWNDFIHDPQEILLALSSFLRPLHSMSVNVPCFISFIEP